MSGFGSNECPCRSPQELWKAELRHHAPPAATEEELHIEQAMWTGIAKLSASQPSGQVGYRRAIAYPSQMVEGRKFVVKDADQVGLANSAVIGLLKSPFCLALGGQVVYV